MAKATRKTSASSVLPFPPQPVVVEDCIPHPNPVNLSKTGLTGPNKVFFTTQDHARVYEVKIKGKVFVGKPGAFKLPFWFGTNSETLTVDPTARKEKFTYTVSALVGPTCDFKGTTDDPPTIIVED